MRYSTIRCLAFTGTVRKLYNREIDCNKFIVVVKMFGGLWREPHCPKEPAILYPWAALYNKPFLSYLYCLRLSDKGI